MPGNGQREEAEPTESAADGWEGMTEEIAAVHLETARRRITGDPRDESERYAEGSEELMLQNERRALRSAWRRICLKR